MTDYDTIQEDHLVLYIEEKTNEETDMRCFIIFDKYEQEYYIAGQRNHVNATQFKLYCKTRSNIFSFIETIFETNCKINYVLYNMSNLEYVDFNVFKQNCRASREIIGYNDVCFKDNKRRIMDILKNIKYVRF
jgi:hypothetical protein